MRFTIAPFYAALLTFGYVILALQVTRNRRRTRTVLGAGADRRMERAIRAHGNFASMFRSLCCFSALPNCKANPHGCCICSASA